MGDKCGRREGREIEETERKQLEEGAQMGCMLDRVRQLEGKTCKKDEKKQTAAERMGGNAQKHDVQHCSLRTLTLDCTLRTHKITMLCIHGQRYMLPRPPPKVGGDG